MMNNINVPIDAMPGEIYDNITVTNFGLISDNGNFISTRVKPFVYEKFGSIPTAQTFRCQTQRNKRRNISIGYAATRVSMISPRQSMF